MINSLSIASLDRIHKLPARWSEMTRANARSTDMGANKLAQYGFTLIEMVAVIIILAIMAATALPKFVNLSQEARLSAVQGMAGGLRSAAALAKSQWLRLIPVSL